MDPQRPSILIVDDEPSITDVVHEYLSTLGYDCTSTSDPEEALRRLRESTFDLVITDLNMGQLSGMDVLKAARGTDASDTMVVLMTAYPTVENAIEALMSGADNYILKPLSLETLKHVVEGSLEKQRLARENVSLKESLALYRASEALEAPLELPEYLNMVLEVALGELEGQAAQLVLLEGDATERRVLQQIRRDPSGGTLKLTEEEMLRLAGELAEESGAMTTTDIGDHGPLLVLPLRAGGDVVGLLAVHRRKGEAAFTPAQAKALSIIGSGAAVAIKNARLYNSLQEQYLGAIRALVTAVEAKDPYTSGHSEKVGQYGQMLAHEVGADQEIIEGMRVVGLLHDAGKIGVQESILLKKGNLTKEEYKHIKDHVNMSMRIIKPLPLPDFVPRAISEHHERLDGSGYPKGLSGEEISLSGRIIAIVDVWDAITSDRVYRTRMNRQEALDTLDDLAIDKLDRELTEIFKNVVPAS